MIIVATCPRGFGPWSGYYATGMTSLHCVSFKCQTRQGQQGRMKSVPLVASFMAAGTACRDTSGRLN